MTVKHHKIFSVYLPKSVNGDEESLTPTMLIEEAYLMSNGTMTPDFKPNDQDRNLLDVVLYPSFIFASKKIHQTESEQYAFINERIDVEFCKMLLCIKPIYRLTEFIDYHFNQYQEHKSFFLKHISFVILPLIKEIIEQNTELRELIRQVYPGYSIVSEIIMTWIREKEDLINPKNKMTSNSKFETNIKNAISIIINSKSSIDSQSNEKKPETNNSKTLTIIGLIISAIMLVIALLTDWDKLF
ncbi:MAG: hypothetical protein CVT93_09765 [Bacteroidetes bacterium HGW-Bacteroidetes-10]|nr:MAG: hypothetical protein CVT93_09765 [Bacteroidetes bacterium HGW-Bacteroidetes-10]